MHSVQFSALQSLSRVWLFVNPRTAAHQDYLFITSSQTLVKLMSIESVMPYNHLILYHPLLLPPSIFPRIRVFSNESVLHFRWPKYWSFSFSSVLPMNIKDGFPSVCTDWISLQSKGLSRVFNTIVQKPWCSAFFIVQLSHPYMTTGKTIALTRRTFVGTYTLIWMLINVSHPLPCFCQTVNPITYGLCLFHSPLYPNLLTQCQARDKYSIKMFC